MMQSLDCNLCKFKNQCLYSKLTSQLIRARWNKLKIIKNYKNGETIFDEGDTPNSLFCVCKGRVKITKTSDNGENAIISIRKPGMMFGYSSMCQGANYTASIAMGDVYISSFNKNTWLEFLRLDFDFSIEIMKSFCTEIEDLQTRIALMLYKNARERIVNVLLNHISFTTQASKIPTVYNLKRNEIAELCGLRVETVVRMLRKLEKKKIIKRERNAIKIIDMKSMLNLKI